MEQSAVYTTRRTVLFIIIVAVIAFIVILISLNTGTIRLSPWTVIKTLIGFGSADEKLIMFEFRLPRILVSMLAGIGLGISGAILQGVSRNSLADPGILGINAGAAFGLIIFVSFFSDMKGPLALLIPFFTFAGGVFIAILIFLLAYDRYRGILPIKLILVGIAVAAGASAVTLLLSLRIDETTYTFTARWLAGNIWGREWIHVWSLLPWIVVLVPIVYWRSKVLDLFALGDDIVTSVGVHVTRNRLIMLFLAVALSCASVSMAGGIGFIGFIAPHISRRLVGPKHRHFLLMTGLIGMTILVIGDTVGRSVFQPNAIPAGIIVAAIGGPYFLYLLFRTKF